MTEKYHWFLRTLHWLIALMILGLIGVGYYMVGLDGKDPLRPTLYFWHKSFGATVLFLVMLRIVVRIATLIPPLPETIPAIVRKLAHAAHYILYFFMITVPVSGYVMSTAYGYKVSVFGWFNLPMLLPKDKPIGDIAHELHEILPYVLLGVVVLHVAGAIKHRFFDAKENDVLKRML